MRATAQDELLTYYQHELTYLRKMGSAFAARYPKIASRLELAPGECADPQVERLLEAFAFLTARIQRQLDSEFPQITSALLGVLYPQFLNPIPAMTVAQFDVDPEQGQLTSGHVIPRHTPVFTTSPQGHTCRFRTCYPVTLWPLDVVYAGLESTAQFDFLDAASDVAAVLRLRLVCRGAALPALTLQRLRFYLHGEQSLVYALYELLFCHVRQVVLLSESHARPHFLPRDAITPVGFDLDEAVLPYPPQAHPGYRLVQEYFAFPDKFLFFDLNHLDQHTSQHSLDVLFLLQQVPQQRLSLDRSTFRLGCTPMINLFRKTAEPVRLDHRHTDYALIPDLRRERWAEIHSLLHVSASSNATDDAQTFEPFYSFRHHMESREHKTYWHARRVPTGRIDLPGTNVVLSFVDLDFTPSLPPVQTVYAHTLCTNRDLATHLSAGALFQIEEAAPLAQITCLSKPTLPAYPPLGGATLWHLISQLSLNHLSLSSEPESLHALREILKLYSVSDQATAHQHISGIRSMTCRQVMRRLGREAWRGFCKGHEITLTFDEALYVGGSALVFAAVLHHFFALYTSVNSFSQLVIHSRQRDGVWKQWPPMAGSQMIL
jgi:type VI secretion system protein ImpG